MDQGTYTLSSYNSMFFSALSANIYNVILAQGPDITQISNETNFQLCYPDLGCETSVDAEQDSPPNEGSLFKWDILHSSQCLQAYATDFLSNRNDVILVIGTNHTESNDTLWEGWNFQAYMTTQPGSTSYNWICSDPSEYNRCLADSSPGSVCPDPKSCSSTWKNINPSKWELTWVDSSPYFHLPVGSPQVNYCISQPAEPRCQLEFNLPLLALIIVFNIAKVMCMALAATKINDKPLVTVGDAIASFTDVPDPHTRCILCTTSFLALEWSSYARSRKPLRVSSPRGEQQSTYFLQIPYRFALPLMAYFIALHWLVSQSIFPVKINYWYHNEPTSVQFINNAANISTSCGYSPVAMILATIVGASLVLSALAIGFFKRIDGDMPIVYSCSIAISAACHPPVDGADPLKPMKWGVVLDMDSDGKQGAGHITFSSGEVLPPIPGCYYP
ncbi:hypothetical protein GYMLUDRAFT_248278 [Collybiopsis luxurians FD-317 M1]|uniref:Uncharacterized protein n=1 Tax=Collybiopsis luxurians FD-317 M1 TaxID=944289 RepID=A0A0D0CL41_9AGAR|nr:hypothetical protein GYMLUDRAFT_248278 [Collybiopsis luxurians FD-317 M1]